MHLRRARLPAVSIEELGDSLFDFDASLGEALAYRRWHSGNLKSGHSAPAVTGFDDVIAQGSASAGHLVLVGLSRIPDGLDHLEFGQGPPSVRPFIPRGVCCHELGVDLGVERP